MIECLNPNKTQSIPCPIKLKLKLKFKSGKKRLKLAQFFLHLYMAQFNAFYFCKMGQCPCFEPNGPNGPLLPLFLWQNGHCACIVSNDPNPIFFCHPIVFFNTSNNVLAAIHMDCTLAGCSSSHEAACIKGKKSLTGAHRLPASPASKASLVTSSRCEQRLNGASMAPEMALVAAPKNGTSNGA